MCSWQPIHPAGVEERDKCGAQKVVSYECLFVMGKMYLHSESKEKKKQQQQSFSK